MKRAIYVLPVLGFLVLAFFLARSLISPAPQDIPSALIDKPAPTIALPPLDEKTRGFTPADLRSGHVTVLNVWASWCIPCRTEAAELRALSGQRGFQLYGLVYKDTPAKARAFLDDAGNPFARIVLDRNGRGGIEWGIYGVPETFIIDGRGIVRDRFVGPITPDELSADVLPAIARAAAGS